MEKYLDCCPIGGCIPAVASKSQAHRLLICAALADRPTTISCPNPSRDIEATARCLAALGAGISYENDTYTLQPITAIPEHALCDCGESGATLRFLLPVAAALGVRTTFRLQGRLPQRPLAPLWELLAAHGCRLTRPQEDTICLQGKLTGGTFPIVGNLSSQFISGLLFALPKLAVPSDILLTTALESAGYVSMTCQALQTFGLEPAPTATGWHIPGNLVYRSPGHCAVEGDWSNAAFWLCAGAISRPVTVTGLAPASFQGDRRILDLLARFGSRVTWQEEAVTVAPGSLRGIRLDVSDIPDLMPPVALVATCAEGVTSITGAARLRLKESDRLQSVAAALRALGATLEELPEGLLIRGGPLSGGLVDSCYDHRIAMLAAIASARCPVRLTGAEAVEKSYPRFWDDFAKMIKEE